MTLSSNEYDRLLTGIRGLDTRLQRLEKQGGSSDVILLKLDHMAGEIAGVKAGVDKINSRVNQAESTIVQHETRVTVLENFCQERVKPALEIVTDNRIAIAVIVAKYGAAGVGIGGGLGIALAIVGKLTGVW